MRYVIVGAGAVGGTIGGRLFEHGHEVVLVARGAHYEALRADGLRLATPGGTATLPVPVVNGPAALRPRADDVLVLAVKTQDSVPALDALAVLPVGSGTAASELPVVCAQNGVENERLALRRFRSVYAIHVVLPATHLEPGLVAAEGDPLSGILDIGRYPSGSDELAMRIAADLTASRFDSRVMPDIMRWKYCKLLRNLVNSVDAALAPDVDTAGLSAKLIAEARTVLEAAGIDPVSFEEDVERRGTKMRIRPVDAGTTRAGTPGAVTTGTGTTGTRTTGTGTTGTGPGLARRAGGSSWQSLARGTGSIEADYLNGEIVLLGRLHGVPTPYNQAMQQVADAQARERRPPRSVGTAELERVLAAWEAPVAPTSRVGSAADRRA